METLLTRSRSKMKVTYLDVNERTVGFQVAHVYDRN